MISSESAKLHFRNFRSFNAGGIQLTAHNLSYRHQLPSFFPLVFPMMAVLVDLSCAGAACHVSNGGNQ